ncbi:uncharacterized protein LOC121380938 [Gigantopelta aegis]|uniref:uncharacterized protein LOC121380938 n=1 Tax=Gigantopelta aegis TaxID=1735272 RepID=UPI001B888146|nr:uncharacterized protein LOC121380938 [Gigantopelta aegis]
MSEGQQCASQITYTRFGPYYQDGGQCTWYSTCPEIEDICSTCAQENLDIVICPVEQCLLYLTNYQAYGNRCGNIACDNLARCMSCMANCSLPQVGVATIPSYRLYYTNNIGYFYRNEI